MFEKKEKLDLTSARIPDSDMPGWINTLREAGLSEEEADEMLIRLNSTYAEMKMAPKVKEELQRIKDDLWEKHQRMLSPEQEAYMRKSIESRFKPK